MKIAIIGGGIGGLTTAIALQQKGIRTTIYEQATTIKSVGAGIILANNAMQVYAHLNINKKIASAGNILHSLNIATNQMNVISKVSLAPFEKKYNASNIAIHRAKLQEILIEELPNDTICLNHQLIELNQHPTYVELLFNNGKSVQVDIVIAADGIHSTVRKQYFPHQPIRQANQICWRGIANISLDSAYAHAPYETWGKGDRFGFVPISASKVYWYALKNDNANNSRYQVANIITYFSHYHPIIQNIIKATPLDTIHTSFIADLAPLSKWYNERVCLLGDAAHATTPNMGQGACQAIEDAYVLAHCLSKHHFYDAFPTYQKLRIKKAHQVVRTSWMLGKLAHLKHPVLIALRNFLLQITPETVNQKQLAYLFNLVEE